MISFSPNVWQRERVCVRICFMREGIFAKWSHFWTTLPSLIGQFTAQFESRRVLWRVRVMIKGLGTKTVSGSSLAQTCVRRFVSHMDDVKVSWLDAVTESLCACGCVFVSLRLFLIMCSSSVWMCHWAVVQLAVSKCLSVVGDYRENQYYKAALM